MIYQAFFKNSPLLFGGLLLTLGACFGSFAALVIDRLPRGESVISPRSYCFACHKSLGVLHNIPIVSWLLLKGRCFYCHTPIGVRLVIIELVFAICLFSLYLKFGISIASLERFTFVFLLVCLAYIDLDFFLLPYSLLFLLLFFGVVFSVIYFFDPKLFIAPKINFALFKTMVFKGQSISIVFDRILGGLVGFIFFSAVNFFSTLVLRGTKRLNEKQWAMGFGDSVLLMNIGFFVGLSHLVLVIFISSFMGSVFGLVVRHFNQHSQEDLAKSALPFGPFLAMAAIYVYLF